MNQIIPTKLALWKSTGFAHKLLDVRRTSARERDGTDIGGATGHNPAQWLDWKDQVPADTPVVVYCAHGHEISQGLAAAPCAMGRDARTLVGGIAAWRAAGRPVQPHTGRPS
jgi:rhodanese-related sulfurtransferase